MLFQVALEEASVAFSSGVFPTTLINVAFAT